MAPISAPTVPNLLSIHPSVPRQMDASSGLNPELLEAQIRINARAMDEIEALKEERKQMMALQEKTAKEKQVLTVKFDKANEQLQFLVKKLGKRDNVSKDKNGPNNGGDGPNGDGDTSKENKAPTNGNQN